MPSIDLPALVRASGIRRQSVTFRPITPTTAQATELAAIYAPAWRIWAESIDRILAGYDPAPLTDGLIRDDAGAMQTAIDATASEFATRLVATITPALRRWAVSVERWHRGRFTASIKAGVGIDLSTVLTAGEVGETLEVWLARNVALVQNISDQAQSRISDAVFRGYQNRTPVREVAKELREAAGLGRKRARRVAADQASKLSSALNDERMADVGLDLWKYRHGGKAHPRAHHLARNGRIYTLRGSKQVNPDGSPMAGGDVIEPGDNPGQPPWCSCLKQGYISLMADDD